MKETLSPSTHFKFDDCDHAIVSPFPEPHQWTKVRCAECGVEGMALVDTTNKNERQHFCYRHNPRIVSLSPTSARKRRSV